MELDDRFSARALETHLPRLGFRHDDAADLRRIAPAVLADTAGRATLAALVQRLDAEPEFLRPVEFSAAERESPWGYGVLPTLAFVGSVDAALARRVRRGQGSDDAYAALADLGQQLWVDRRTHGAFGLHPAGWVAMNWAGTLAWWGRLQFDAERMPVQTPTAAAGSAAYCSPIPESGPLDPAAVDAALSHARRSLPGFLPEVDNPLLYCDSWLLDPVVSELAGAGSRTAGFAARFDDLVDDGDADRDALYFTFRREPPVDLETLPTDTRLQRGIVAHLRGGGHFRHYLGRLKEDA